MDGMLDEGLVIGRISAMLIGLHRLLVTVVMHWLTAIFGLLALYSIVGLIHAYAVAHDSPSVTLWFTLVLLGFAAAFLNHWRIKRRQPGRD